MGVGGACGRQHWGLRWSSPWGHEACEGCAEMNVGGRMRAAALGHSVELPMGPRTCEGCAKMSVGAACGRLPWGLRWSGATKRVRGVPKWVWGAHAGGSTGTFGGTPHEATKRVRGVPK
eukprot:5832843-Pyramimonas_sp.AAC.1